MFRLPTLELYDAVQLQCLSEQSVALQKELDDLREPSAARCKLQYELGWNYFLLGEFGSALQLFEKLSSESKSVYGPVHATVAAALNGKAYSLGMQGESDHAASTLEECLQILMLCQPSQRQAQALVLAHLAQIRLHQRRWQECEDNLKESLEHHRSMNDDKSLLSTLATYYRLLQQTDRFHEATAIQQEMANIFKRIPGAKIDA